jgi:hypothetical protein
MVGKYGESDVRTTAAERLYDDRHGRLVSQVSVAAIPDQRPHSLPSQLSGLHHVHSDDLPPRSIEYALHCVLSADE